jgi:hypothetical protein
VHLVGYLHSCITMHGFMNIKLTVKCSSKTHTELIVVFQLHEELRERATMLRYTHIAYLLIYRLMSGHMGLQKFIVYE